MLRGQISSFLDRGWLASGDTRFEDPDRLVSVVEVGQAILSALDRISVRPPRLMQTINRVTMMRKMPDPNRLAVLDSVFLGDIEPTASTIVFRLVTEPGEILDLDLHMMLRALRQCCDHGAFPALPHDWIVRAAGAHGKAFQEDA